MQKTMQDETRQKILVSPWLLMQLSNVANFMVVWIATPQRDRK
jgi:hypothetical protein